MIKWITDYLATAPYDLIVASDDLRIIDVRDLVDKHGNLPVTVRDRLEHAVASIKRGEKIVVCCDYGMSRSNAVAAGILSLNEGLPFSTAVGRVMDSTGEKNIKIEVLSVVAEALQDSGAAQQKKSANEKRILVTGGSGFIGAALVHRLSLLHNTYAPTRADVDLETGAVNLNLLVKERGIDCIVHLANPHIYNTSEAMAQTLLLLRNVLDVCRENQLKLIYPSGWEVFSGYRTSQLLASEDLPLLPKGIYGETKFLCEHLVQQYSRNFGVEHIVLRSGPIYGGNSERPRFIFNFLEKAAHGQTIIAHKYLNGFPALDFTHIDDFIGAILALVESDYHGPLHIGSGESISTTDIAHLIIDTLGSQSKVRHNELQEYTANIAMDSRRAQAILRWELTIPFATGLRRLIDERALATERRG